MNPQKNEPLSLNLSKLVKIRRLPHADGLADPAYQSTGAAGFDLVAALETELTLDPQMRHLVPTGLVMEIPTGFEGQVRPRSGLALKKGLTVLNAPGTIDSDYRGEVQVLLINHGTEPITLARGDRIAQMIIAPVVQVMFEFSDTLSDSERGAGGFGSTGITGGT